MMPEILEGYYSSLYLDPFNNAHIFSCEDLRLNLNKKMALTGREKEVYMQVFAYKKGTSAQEQ